MPLLLSKRAGGVGTFESVLTSLRKEDIYPKVIMKSTDPHVLVEMIEEGVEGVAIIPSLEVHNLKFRNCRAVELCPSFKYFQPVILRLKSFPLPPSMTTALERAVVTLKSHG